MHVGLPVCGGAEDISNKHIILREFILTIVTQTQFKFKFSLFTP